MYNEARFGAEVISDPKIASFGLKKGHRFPYILNFNKNSNTFVNVKFEKSNDCLTFN